MNVLIADDHAMLRTGIATMLSLRSDIEVVAEAADLVQLTKALSNYHVDVLILDVNMPGSDVLSTIANSKNAQPHLKIVVFTMRKEDAFAAEIMRAGADAYLSKDRKPEELLDAVLAVTSGKKFVTDQVAKYLIRPDVDLRDDPHNHLAARERQIFDLFVEGATVSQIAEQLNLSPTTITTYLARVRKKLGVDNNYQLIQYAFRKRLL